MALKLTWNDVVLCIESLLDVVDKKETGFTRSNKVRWERRDFETQFSDSRCSINGLETTKSWKSYIECQAPELTLYYTW